MGYRRGTLLWIVLAAGCDRGPRELPERLQIDTVVRDLLADPPPWNVTREHPAGPPRVEVISPAVNGRIDGADMPALVLPPPGELSFELGQEASGARLRARAGVDFGTFVRLRREMSRARLVLEVLAPSGTLAQATLPIEHGGQDRNAWVELGPEGGMPVSAGMRITLRNTLLLEDGTPLEAPFGVRAGFGGLRLERTRSRARTRSSTRHPNLVLIVMDTLRADRLATYGYERPTSPSLDALAARGTLFEQALSSSSWTWPATASILTGLSPPEHGVTGEGSSFLGEPIVTLAERLQAAGFTTAAWSGNPIVSAARNLDQGFERFESSSVDFAKTDTFFGRFEEFLRARAGTRFFAYLHLAEPHEPLSPLPEAGRLLAPGIDATQRERCDALRHRINHGQAIRPDGSLDLGAVAASEVLEQAGLLYDACVWSGDHWLGRTLELLAALDLEDETIVAFTSDHGEELFEHGFFGHGQSLHQELVHVPLVIAGPGLVAGRRIARSFSSTALAPYLAALVGAPFPGDTDAEGVLARTGNEPIVFSTTKGWWKGRDHLRILGLAQDAWRLHLAPDGAPWGASEPSSGGDLALYRLPDEEHDLSATHPDEAARLKELLLQRTRELESRRVGAEFPAGGATLQLLERLGYAGDDSANR